MQSFASSEELDIICAELVITSEGLVVCPELLTPYEVMAYKDSPRIHMLLAQKRKHSRYGSARRHLNEYCKSSYLFSLRVLWYNMGH